MGLSWSAPPGGASQAGALPFSRGTTWTYRHTLGQTGTLTKVYGGQTAYRGRTYHVFTITSTLKRGTVTRLYQTWTGTHFRQAALKVTDPAGNIEENIFDRTFEIGVRVDRSGTAQFLGNGFALRRDPWHFAATPRGLVEVTVPAGTFQAALWEVVFRLGEHKTLSSVYTVGLTEVRRVDRLYWSGSFVSTSHLELVRGPVR
jgi:hypothetical protein